MLWNLNLGFVVGLATPLRPNFLVFFNFRPIIYTYEDYYEHTLRDASVLTIRAQKAQTRDTVLDTGATCSASNNPAEILEILPFTVLLKSGVVPSQSMRFSGSPL